MRSEHKQNGVTHVSEQLLPLTPVQTEGGGWGEGFTPRPSLQQRAALTPPPNLGPLCGPSPQGEGENISLPLPRMLMSFCPLATTA